MAIPRDWAVPALDATNHAWFTSGRLVLRVCAGCGTVQHPPEEICHACGAMDFGERTVAPYGTVFSYTVAHYAVHPALQASTPYAVVLVGLDEVPEVRVVGNLHDVPLEEIAIGLPVEADWEERTAEDGEIILLPQWRRRTGDA